MRILLHSPRDTVAGALAFAAISAIIANALFLQAERHPSPMFGSVVAIPAAALAPASPLPRPRPVEAAAAQAEPKLVDPRPAEPKPADPLTNLVKATSAAPAAPPTIARPPAPIPASSRNETSANPAPGSRRVAAVQRALTEYGYGQLKPTGTVGSETQAAIQKFERERKIPVTGQMSDRLVRELTAVIGRPIE
jgi:Putative peptidoglycan binding domain